MGLIRQVQKLRLGTKLVSGFLSVLLLAGALTGVSLYQQRRLSSEFAEVYDRDLLAVAAVESARVDVAKLGRSMRQTILAPDSDQRDAGLALVSVARREVAEHIDDLRPRLDAADKRESLTEFETQFRAYDRNVETALALMSTDQAKAIAFVSTVEFQDVGQRVDQALESISVEKQDGAKRRVAAAMARADEMFGRLVLLLIGGLVFGALVASVVAQSIRTPVNNLRQAVERVAKGEFDTEIVHTADHNEIGDLARSIDVLRGEAKQMADQRWLKSHLGVLSAELQSCDDLKALAVTFLAGLAPHLEIGAATIYAAEENGALRLLGSFGIADPERLLQALGAGPPSPFQR